MDVLAYYVEDFCDIKDWGDLTKVNPLLILLIDSIMEFTGYDVSIHCAYDESGHVTNSQHYRGAAVDFHFKTDDDFFTQYDLLKSALKCYNLDNFVGLGIYPYWNNPGFHLDIRGNKARWGRDKAGKYVGIDTVLAEIS